MKVSLFYRSLWNLMKIGSLRIGISWKLIIIRKKEISVESLTYLYRLKGFCSTAYLN